MFINNFQDLTYMHPTFASFKNSKQNPLKKQEPDSSTSQPRTFQELKNISNTQNQKNTKITKLPTKTFRNIVTQKQGHIKKCSSGISFQGLTASRNSQNPITKIKNPDNVVPSYTKKNNNQSRPPIIGPSLLKNKSFIQPCSNDVSGTKLLTGRSLYSISNNESIELSDQLSDSVNRSIENSYQQGNSYENVSNILSNSFKDSLDLEKRQRKSDAKMSFSRKSSRSHLYKIDNKMSLPETTKIEDSLQEFTISKDMYCSIESNGTLCKSYQATEKKNQNSINFSKKFKYFKHQKSEHRNSTLEDFNLIDEIGQGKYGKVYSAEHKETHFICALKVISKALIKQQNIEEPFFRQIKIQMYLNHPNIVKLYGFFHDNENIYLIMESCLDGQLFKMMKDRKNFEQNEILSILSDIYEAVSFLHCHGIIHRDLKPQNIVIQNGVYKLCDFGWAAYAKGQSRSTFCGTPLYVSPQVLKGEQYDAKADVWGLGVLTYQLAYGRVPFPIWNKSDMVKIVKDPVYFPSWTNVSQKMQSLIKWMLQKQPQNRASMNQILSGGLINEFLGKQKGIRSEIQLLF